MDEMKMLRDRHDAQPAPAPEVTADARSRLIAHTRPTSRRQRRGFQLRRFSRPAMAGLGLVAAGTAAVVGIATVDGTSPASPGHPAQSHPGQGRPVELTARSILLTAADKAAAEPMGRYWRVNVTDGQSYPTDPATGGHMVAGYSREWSLWLAGSGSVSDVTYIRVTKPGATFGAGPAHWSRFEATPAQKRKDAAKTMKACHQDAKTCTKVAGFRSLSQADQLKLASDPAQLNELLYPNYFPKQPLDSVHKLTRGFMFLINQPAPPQVRAEAFRALAALPGVRSIGAVKDGMGRTGIGLEATPTMHDGSASVFDMVYVLDPKTYQVLGDQRVLVKADKAVRDMKPGTIVSYQVVVQAGWTDQAPHHP